MRFARLALTALLSLPLMACTAVMYEGGVRPLNQVSFIDEWCDWNSETEILEVDGERVGDFRHGVEVLPGEHRLRARLFNARLMTDRIGDPITEVFTTEAGHTYEIRGEPSLGGARWRPVIVDVTEAVADPPPLAESLWGAVPRFLGSRLLDLLDIGEASMTAGLGTLVHIHPTRPLQIGLGGFSGLRAGWMGRRFPLKFDAQTGAALSVFEFQARRPRDFWRLGAALHLLIVGAEVGLDPPEMGDFLAGWLGFDPIGDDLRAPLPGEVLLRGGGH
jgi:hypothetical protein